MGGNAVKRIVDGGWLMVDGSQAQIRTYMIGQPLFL